MGVFHAPTWSKANSACLACCAETLKTNHWKLFEERIFYSNDDDDDERRRKMKINANFCYSINFICGIVINQYRRDWFGKISPRQFAIRRERERQGEIEERKGFGWCNFRKIYSLLKHSTTHAHSHTDTQAHASQWNHKMHLWHYECACFT